MDFRGVDTGAVIVTNGAKDVMLLPKKHYFQKTTLMAMPVSAAVTEELKRA